MTVEEYRQRMINAFHNADCDNLIALVALPTKKEFEHLEWLLKNHYLNQKQEPCDDCISRRAVIDALNKTSGIRGDALKALYDLPPVTPKEKPAEWYDENGCKGACEGYMSAGVICSQCGEVFCGYIGDYNFCPNCGARMVRE